MRTYKLSIVLLVGLMVVFLPSVLFTVVEGQKSIVLRLGQIKGDATRPMVLGAGLHIKWPFIETVKTFDVRIQTLDIKSSTIFTKDKKQVEVDYYVKWSIDDEPQYYKSTGGDSQVAEKLLSQQLNDRLREEFGNRTITDVISDLRLDIMNALREEARQGANGLGLKVVDVRIKRIDLPEATISAVFATMRAERQEAANRYQSQGDAAGEAIRAQADAKVIHILAEAKSNAAQIRADGDKKAAEIYAKAYAQDPEFYAFYRSLMAYQTVFGEKDILVLQPNSDFFQYLNHAKAGQTLPVNN